MRSEGSHGANERPPIGLPGIWSVTGCRREFASCVVESSLFCSSGAGGGLGSFFRTTTSSHLVPKGERSPGRRWEAAPRRVRLAGYYGCILTVVVRKPDKISFAEAVFVLHGLERALN